jgi:hypothetical protein
MFVQSLSIFFKVQGRMQFPPTKEVRSTHVTIVNYTASLSVLVSFLKILTRRKNTQVLWEKKYKAFVIEVKLPGIFITRKTCFYSPRINSNLRNKSNFGVFALWKHRIIVNVSFFVTYQKRTKMHYVVRSTLNVTQL